MCLASAAMDCSMCEAVRLRKTSMWVCAPTRWKARAESYSELVPGKVGMRTFGGEALVDEGRCRGSVF